MSAEAVAGAFRGAYGLADVVVNFERFMAMVDSSAGDNACHPWTGWINSQTGYGHFRIDRRVVGAHRWLLGHLRGEPLRRGEEALHSCDNPPCVNPNHLRVGTHAENMRDMAERGRGRGWKADNTHCPQGHPYQGGNVQVRPGGARRCRECSRLADERKRRERGVPIKQAPFCPKGHEFTPENTRKKPSGRACKRCAREYSMRYRARQRGAA